MFAEFGAMTASCIEGHKDRDSCVKSCDLQLRGLGGQKFLPTFTFFFRCGDYFFGAAHWHQLKWTLFGHNTDSCLQLEPKHVTILQTFFSNVSILESQKMHHPTSDLLLLPHETPSRIWLCVSILLNLSTMTQHWNICTFFTDIESPHWKLRSIQMFGSAALCPSLHFRLCVNRITRGRRDSKDKTSMIEYKSWINDGAWEPKVRTIAPNEAQDIDCRATLTHLLIKKREGRTYGLLSWQRPPPCPVAWRHKH